MSSASTYVQSIPIPPESREVSLQICLMIDGKPYFVKTDPSCLVKIDNAAIVPKIHLTISDASIGLLKLSIGDVQVEKESKITNIETSNGDVNAYDVGGYVKTSNGDITANIIHQSVTSSNGDISANVIHGDAKTSMGDIFRDGKKESKKRQRTPAQTSFSSIPGVEILHQNISSGGIGCISGQITNTLPGGFPPGAFPPQTRYPYQIDPGFYAHPGQFGFQQAIPTPAPTPATRSSAKQKPPSKRS